MPSPKNLVTPAHLETGTVRTQILLGATKIGLEYVVNILTISLKKINHHAPLTQPKRIQIMIRERARRGLPMLLQIL